MKAEWKMRVDAEKCRVCLMCQLVCSLIHHEIFDPERSCLKITSTIEPDGRIDVGISFDDHCDGCGLCVKYCVYGALSRGKSQRNENKKLQD
jgi:ferredoxin